MFHPTQNTYLYITDLPLSPLDLLHILLISHQIRNLLQARPAVAAMHARPSWMRRQHFLLPRQAKPFLGPGKSLEDALLWDAVVDDVCEPDGFTGRY